MSCKQISLLCIVVSAAIANMSVEFSPADTSTDKCPEVTDVTKEMPRIVNHLMEKAYTSMVFALRGLRWKVRGECSKTSFQSQCSVSANFPTKFECSVIARHLKFACVSHTGPLSEAEAQLTNDRFISQVNMGIVVELQEGATVRVTDMTSFKANIPGLSEAVIQKAIFAGLKAAVKQISCSLA